VWPPPLENVFDLAAYALNPAKWGTDTVMGTLSLLVFNGVSWMAQPVFWLYGRTVGNFYGEGEATGINIVTYTPVGYTYGSGFVHRMGQTMAAVGMAFMGLMLCWMAIRELVRLATGESRALALGENARRLIVATILVSGGSWWIVSTLIDLNNVMIYAILGWDPLADALQAIMFNQVSDLLLTAGLILETALMLFLLILVLFILALLMLGRIILLDVLLILAPLFGVFYAAEETEHLFRRWLQVGISTVFYQFVAMVVLRLALALLVESWQSHAGGHPIILGLLGMIAALMAISVPPILGFALSKSASQGQQLIRRAVIAAM
jgi:hypothetical protein